MFFENIRSERLLMRQVADRLSVRWYVGYDLDEPLPDHSTRSRDSSPLWLGGVSPFRRRPSSNNASKRSSSGARNCTLTPRKSRPMPISIRWHRVLRLRRVQPSENTSLPCLLGSLQPLSTPKKSPWTPPPSNPSRRRNPFQNRSRCPHLFPRRSVRNLRLPTHLAMIASLRKVGLTARFMVATSEQQIYG